MLATLSRTLVKSVALVRSRQISTARFAGILSAMYSISHADGAMKTPATFALVATQGRRSRLRVRP